MVCYCTQNCPNGASVPRCTAQRRKRTVTTEDVPTKPIVIGPVYVLEEEEGNSFITLLLDYEELKMTPIRYDNFTGIDNTVRLKPESKDLPSPTNTLSRGLF